MSDRISYSQAAPREKLHGIIADTTVAGRRGWIGPAIFATVGASIRVPGVRHGSLAVRNRRGQLQAGANAPTAGRAAGSPRDTVGGYAPSSLDWNTRILSLQTDKSPQYAVENLPWIGNLDAMDPNIARQQQMLWEQDTAEMLNGGVLLQQERYIAETFFGTDLAGTGVAFDYANVSAAAAYNPAGATFADEEFDFAGFVAACRKAIHLRMGAAAAESLTIIAGENTAYALEKNLQLLGIKVVGDTSAGVTSQMGDARLTSDGLTRRITGLSGVGRFFRGGAVFDNSLPGSASQTNAFLWPDGLWIGSIGNAAPRQNPGTSTISVVDTAVLEIINKPGSFNAKLNEDETILMAWADKIVGYKVVNSDFGLAFANA